MQLLAVYLTLLEIPTINGQHVPAEPVRVEATSVQSDPGMCPLAGDSETARNKFTESTTEILRQFLDDQTCGGTTGWKRVAFINMTDTSYNCPPGLALTSFSTRTCGPTTLDGTGGCDSAIFSVNSKYRQVCGRVIGYTYYYTCGFQQYDGNGRTLESFYVDGVSLTHGAAGQREHIWTFVSAFSEHDATNNCYCPCVAGVGPAVARTPPYIGDDYFCESGRNNDNRLQSTLYSNDPLWDGNNCPSTSTCCEFSNPPWFTKTLPNPTIDDIELRLCGWNLRDASTPIQLVELYVK